MIIPDLEHLEVVDKENCIQGGQQLESTAAATATALANNGSVFIDSGSFKSANQGVFFFPLSTSASSFAFGSTRSF
jgi:hypothetical protein